MKEILYEEIIETLRETIEHQRQTIELQKASIELLERLKHPSTIYAVFETEEWYGFTDTDLRSIMFFYNRKDADDMYDSFGPTYSHRYQVEEVEVTK